jgi:hypothetical protein
VLSHSRYTGREIQNVSLIGHLILRVVGVLLIEFLIATIIDPYSVVLARFMPHI